MTWQHIKAVWASSKSKGASRLVMLCIADHANGDNLAWPGTQLIVDETQVSDRQVQRAIDGLVQAGELEIVELGNGRGNSTVYRLLLPLKGDTLSLKGDTVTPNDQPRKGDTVSLKGDMVSERVTFETEKGDMVSPEVIREISLEIKEEIKKEKEGDPLMELVDFFCEQAGVELPKGFSNGRADAWLKPIVEIYRGCDENYQCTKEIVKEAINVLKKANYIVATPNSILKTAKNLMKKREVVAWSPL
jgi:hypothetical protein